jgi:hypothetical protein
MGDSKKYNQRLRQPIAIIAAIVVLVGPWALYFTYLKKSPFYPVKRVIHLFWSSNGEKFDKTLDRIDIARIMTGEREKLVFEFPKAITFKRLRLDPMERINGVITLYTMSGYSEKGNRVLEINFNNQHAGWTCVDCYAGDPGPGWQIYTHGALAIASPMLPETSAKRVEVDLQAIPLDAKEGFVSWLAGKIF